MNRTKLFFYIFGISPILFLFLTDLEIWRYQEYPEHYAFHNFNKKNYDIAFFGNSQSVNAIDASKFNLDLKVVDLSRAWKGQAQLYVMIEDFLKKQRVKTIFLEYGLWPGKRYFSPNLQYTGKITHMVEALWVENFHSFFDKLKIFSDWLKKRFFSRLKIIATFSFNKMKEKKFSQHIDLEKRPFGKKLFNINNREINFEKDWESNILNWNLRTNKEDLNVYYTKKIIQLAKKNNIDVVLYHTPVLFSPVISEGTANHVQKIFGVPFIYPSLEESRLLYEVGNYRDGSHMSSKGAAVFTSYLYKKWSELND